MLAIKFKPLGKKHQKTYRIIVAEKRSKLNGRFVDDLGWVNPHTDAFNIKTELAKKWIANGAQPTDSVHNIFVKAGVIVGAKIAVHSKSKKKEEEQKTVAKPVSQAQVAPTPSSNNNEEIKAESVAPAEEVSTETVQPEEKSEVDSA